MKALKVCVLGCSGSTSGEVTLALDWVGRCKRPMELHAVVGKACVKVARASGAVVHAYPDLGAVTSLARIRASLTEVAADVVILADLLLYSGMVGEFGGSLPAVVEQTCKQATVLALDLYDWDHNRDAVDLFGRAGMKHNGVTPPAPVAPPGMGRLMPSPYLPMARSTPGRGRYAMMEDQGATSSTQRAAARAALGLPAGKLVVWTTSPWQHLATRHPESAKVAQHLPALLMRLLQHVSAQVGPLTLVHLGPQPYAMPDDVDTARYLHVPQLPPAHFLDLLRAADLMVTPNVIASSAIRAASMRLPVAMLHLGSPPAVARGAVAQFLDAAAPAYANSVWPLGMFALMGRILDGNTFADLAAQLDLMAFDDAVAGVSSLLSGPAASALQDRQEKYFKRLGGQMDTPDMALDAALQPSRNVPAPQKLDPIQATWKVATRYFWDREFQQQLMRRVPEAQPGQGTPFPALWEKCQSHSLCDPWRAENICARFLEVSHLDGDVIECGTWRGGVSVMLALLCRQLGLKKKVVMVDSFEGLPAPDPTVDRFHQQGWCHAPREDVERLVALHGVGDLVEIHQGWFENTLPRLKHQAFCFAHLDGDLYQSTMDCLTHVVPKVVRGGVVVVDDYHDSGEGVKRAVDGFVAVSGETLHAGPIPQVYFRKGQTGGRPGRVSTRELKRNTPYARLVREVMHTMQRDAATVARMGRLLSVGP
jgi:hypothetical protein